MINEARYLRFIEKKEKIEAEVERLKNTYVSPNEKVNSFLDTKNSTRIKSGSSLSELLRRPEISYEALAEIDDDRPEIPVTQRMCPLTRIAEQIEITVKYEGYVKRQMMQVKQFEKLEKRRIPSGVDYAGIYGLRLEARQKLAKIKPESIGQASRISGVSPADISVLLIYLEQIRRNEGDG